MMTMMMIVMMIAVKVADAAKAVGAMAIGYGVWEWRREIWQGIRKVGSFFTSSK